MQAGLPYFTLPELGPFKPFGILVATGVIVGIQLIYRRIQRLSASMEPKERERWMEHARRLVWWCVICGFIGAHVFDVLAYQTDALRRDPLLLFKVWAGISSFGGFIGGTTGFFIYVLRQRLPIGVWADTIMWGFVPGFTFGRLGCTIVHDHIGRLTDFPLAQYYSEEVIRAHGYPIQPGLHHNLGLYEFVFMLLLCAMVWAIDRKPRRPGVLITAVIVAYVPVRFLMDFLRIPVSDPRYFGLTFAQWMSVLLFGLALYLLARLTLTPAPQAAAEPAAGAAPATAEQSKSKAPGGSKPAAAGQGKSKASGGSKKRSGGARGKQR